jgi:hypothetical protein
MKTFEQYINEMALNKHIKASVRTKINNEISNIARGFHTKIPLSAILNVLETNGYRAIQEDGTPWQGMLIGNAECGTEKAKSQKASIDLVSISDNTPVDNMLLLMWCTLQSGRYEVVSYVS